jgi:hypothetical protein
MSAHDPARRRLLCLLAVLVLVACRASGDGAGQDRSSGYDSASLRIELDRGSCFGSCPSYRLTVEGSGWITYEGRSNVLVHGTVRRRVDPNSIAALAHRFEAAGFFRLRHADHGGSTDGPTYTLRLVIAGRSKTVVDYLGGEAGMPSAVTELERLVDEIGQTRRWVEGDESTVDALRAQGWNFQTAAATAMMVSAAAHGQTEIVRDLHAAGVRATARIGEITAVEAAAHSGSFDTWQLLVSHDALRPAGPPLHARVAAAAAANGNARIVRAMMPFRFDVNAGPEPLLGRAMSAQCESVAECDRPAVIRLLLAGGANPNRANDHGDTALHYAETAEEAQLLVEAGANVNA